MSNRKSIRKTAPRKATRKTARKEAGRSSFEQLEQRQLMSTTTVVPLPYRLDFGADAGELFDGAGRGTGFTRVQDNKLGNQYQPALLNLDTADGVLKVTSTGTSKAGSNSGSDNTQVNALETQFDGTTSGFTINTRLIGPLSNLDAPYEMAGIYLGPDQDNFIKLVAINLGNSGGQVLQFKDEFNTGSGPSSSLSDSQSRLNIGSFAALTTLDLRLVGDAATGKVSAYYAVNGGSFNKLSFEYTVPSSKQGEFFGPSARAGILTAQKNDGPPITSSFDSFEITAGTVVTQRPRITGTRPADGSINISRDTFIAADLSLASVNGVVDSSTLNSSTVKLVRKTDGKLIQGTLNTTGGGDAIVFTPSVVLDANVSYSFSVTEGVKDTNGVSFLPYTSTFTTGTAGVQTDTSIAFANEPQASTQGKRYTSLAIGPDHKLYATTIEGLIIRYDMAEDGSLGAGQVITTVQDREGKKRSMTGLVFDPASTAANPIVYVSHGDFAGIELKEYSGLYTTTAQNWSGKITRLSGPNLQTAQDVVTGLPRSVKDHQTYQMSFGPDGWLYVSQGAQNAMGAPDKAWGLRPEELLSAAILRINVQQIGTGTVNVQTSGVSNPYNPYAPNAPVTIFATGVRSAYDLLFHSNGHLYSGVNGSAAGGNTPVSPNVAGSGLTNVATQSDYLLDVQAGKYYGHPDPLRSEYILDGGNPTAGYDPGEVLPDGTHPATYPVGTLPESTYGGFALDFGFNQSPNGLIEYKGNALGGKLNGKILIVRYSGGDDIMVLSVGPDGKITDSQSGYAGLTGFVNPLDLVEDSSTGFVYVAEFGDQAAIPGAEARITLLKPQAVVQAPPPAAGQAVAQLSRGKVYLSDLTTTSAAGAAQTLRINNAGSGPLVISAANFTGTNSSEFSLVNPLASSITIPAGGKYDFYVQFKATNAGQVRTASLDLSTNDPAKPTLTAALRALGSAGAGGNYEPSLQRILDLYQIPVNVGDTTPDTTDFPVDTAYSADEVTAPRLVKGSAGVPITVELLATYANQVANTAFGWYEAGNTQSKNLLATVNKADAQSIAPLQDGKFNFDPGTAAFGIYGNFTLGSTTNPLNRDVYSENVLNTWETNTGRQKKVRFYQLRDSTGVVVPDAYVFAFEEYNVTFDQNDVVGIIRNVRPAAAAPEIGLENLDNVGVPNSLAFNRITHPDSSVPNQTHDTATIRIRNTGDQPLAISSMVLSNADFQILSGGGATTLGVNAFVDVKVKFVYDNSTAYGNLLRTGTLTINSNDPDEATKTVALRGIWQSYSENQPNGKSAEPVAQTVVDAFGYKVNLTNSGQSIDTHGVATKVGEEILSPLLQRADSGLPVTARMLAAYHQQSNPSYTTNSTLYWYDPTKMNSSTGKPTVTKLYKHAQVDSQSLLPRLDGSTTAPATASFSPSGTFGLNIDGNNGTFSEDQYNTPNDANNQGHGWRYYQAKDASGKIIPNTYLAIQDYVKVSYANYDYQDNMFLLTNVMPVSPPVAPTNLTASASSAGVNLTWTPNTEGNVTGYNVYRSDSATGIFTKLTNDPVAIASYLDASAPAGLVSYYRVVAATYQAQESAAATASATRPGGTPATAPAAPTALVATAPAPTQATLNWTDNSNNENGFKIERRTGGGIWQLLTTTAANATSYVDAAVVASTAYSYRVSATNAVGDSVKSNEASVTTPSTASMSSADIGNPTPAGQVTTVSDGSAYDVSVGGLDIWGTSDQFNFIYQPRTGNFDVKTQVTSLSGSDPQAMAGLMARETLDANSRNVMLKLRPYDYRMGYRATTGGSTSGLGSGSHDAGTGWARLKREGNVFTTFSSADGANWTAVGQVTLSLNFTLFVGLATSAHTTTSAASASYRNYGEVGAVTPPPAETAPSAPTNATAVAASPTTVNLTWTDTANNESSFRIERRPAAGGAWAQVGLLSADQTTFSDTTVIAQQSYLYRIFATNGVGDSLASNEAAVTTPGNSTGQQTTTTLTSVGDAFVRDGAYANTTYGTDSDLLAKQSNAGYNRIALIKFDLSSVIAAGGDVSGGATLRLNAALSDTRVDQSLPMQLYVIDGSWNEASVTYNNQPTLGEKVSDFSIAGSTRQPYTFDIKTAIQQALAAGKTTIGFAVVGTVRSDAYAVISARESGPTGPQITVTSAGSTTPATAPAAASSACCNGHLVHPNQPRLGRQFDRRVGLPYRAPHRQRGCVAGHRQRNGQRHLLRRHRCQPVNGVRLPRLRLQCRRRRRDRQQHRLGHDAGDHPRADHDPHPGRLGRRIRA